MSSKIGSEGSYDFVLEPFCFHLNAFSPYVVKDWKDFFSSKIRRVPYWHLQSMDKKRREKLLQLALVYSLTGYTSQLKIMLCFVIDIEHLTSLWISPQNRR